MTPCKDKKSQQIAGDECSQLEKDKLKQLVKKIGQELSIRLLKDDEVTVEYITNLFTKMTSSLSQTQINHVKSTILKSIIHAARGPENKHRDRLSAYFRGGVEIGLVTFALLFDNTALLSYARVHLCPEELSAPSNEYSLYNYVKKDIDILKYNPKVFYGGANKQDRVISCEYVQCLIDFGILKHNDTDHRCAKTGTTLQFSIPPDDGKFVDEEIVFLRTCEAARSRKNSSKEASTQEASGKLAKEQEELVSHAEKILLLHIDTGDLCNKLADLRKRKKKHDLKAITALLETAIKIQKDNSAVLQEEEASKYKVTLTSAIETLTSMKKVAEDKAAAARQKAAEEKAAEKKAEEKAKREAEKKAEEKAKREAEKKAEEKVKREAEKKAKQKAAEKKAEEKSKREAEKKAIQKAKRKAAKKAKQKAKREAAKKAARQEAANETEAMKRVNEPKTKTTPAGNIPPSHGYALFPGADTTYRDMKKERTSEQAVPQEEFAELLKEIYDTVFGSPQKKSQVKLDPLQDSERDRRRQVASP